MENLRQYHAIVEQAIANLPLDPGECQGENPGLWYLKKGSARITVEVFIQEKTLKPYCRVYSPVIPVPKMNFTDLYEELLDLNMQYIGITFGKTNNWIYVKADREAEGMDINEMFWMINRVGLLADEWDDKLKEKYFQGELDLDNEPKPEKLG